MRVYRRQFGRVYIRAQIGLDWSGDLAILSNAPEKCKKRLRARLDSDYLSPTGQNALNRGSPLNAPRCALNDQASM